MNGVIAKKMEGKDFGFIIPDDKKPGDRDMFFHRSSVTDPVGFDGLNEGDKVSFEVQDSPKGPNAANVQKI